MNVVIIVDKGEHHTTMQVHPGSKKHIKSEVPLVRVDLPWEELRESGRLSIMAYMITKVSGPYVYITPEGKPLV